MAPLWRIATIGVLCCGVLAGCASATNDAARSAPTPDSSNIAVASAPAGTASSTPDSTASDTADEAIAQDLVEHFYSLLQRQDVEALDAFLDPAFQEARANGTTANKQQYLATTPDVGAYRLSDFHVTRAGDALIARYTFDGREMIDQQLYLSDPRQRLSVFVLDGDSWKLIAHANTATPDNPESASPSARATAPSPTGSAATTDTTLERETQQAFFTALQQQDTDMLDTLLSPAFQLVRADGSAANKSAYLADPATISDFELSNFYVTRSGDILVASFDGTTQETVNGAPYKTTAAPRFAVMQQEGNVWRIIAQANFNTPSATNNATAGGGRSTTPGGSSTIPAASATPGGSTTPSAAR